MTPLDAGWLQKCLAMGHLFLLRRIRQGGLPARACRLLNPMIMPPLAAFPTLPS
jgi:hypothetical protein